MWKYQYKHTSFFKSLPRDMFVDFREIETERKREALM